ncbi:hypothetical protein JW988_05635 [Candidatus Bathyarchaeota archaeon]|nr:hypothetical protein [Candidatus Bathyarchaeota archaeon]
MPGPREVSPVNLRRLSFTTLQVLDSDYGLSTAAFDIENVTLWNEVQIALSASLPANVIYNLTVYEVGSSASGAELYNNLITISNTDSLGTTSDASSYLAASANVTFNVIPEKIGEDSGEGTLYILNCSDANGWWITGYTAQSLAEDLYKLLSPYFVNTVMVQNTAELGQLLGGTPLEGETLENAVIINTCGEAVPIPTAYCTSPYSDNSYARYSYFLGQKVNEYNWTWASIVGYPFYYVSNTAAFPTQQNDWGIYGMRMTAQGGVRAFLQGLDNQAYVYNSNGVTSDVGVVTLTSEAMYCCNYYGIYPSEYQTSTRALSNSILSTYDLEVGLYVFNPVGNYIPGAIYRHVNSGSTSTTGTFLALGLTRTPDIRLTCLSLLTYYQPRLYRSEYTSYGTSRLIILQLGFVGAA